MEKLVLELLSLLFFSFFVHPKTISRKDQDGFNEPYILGLLECDWDAFIRAKRKV